MPSSVATNKSEGAFHLFPNQMRTLPDFQAFHRWFDEQKGFGSDVSFNMILLTGEVGEVAQVIKRILWKASLTQAESGGAMQTAVAEYRASLGDELADCMAYIFKLANDTGIDLQQAYLGKMERNLRRTWTTPEATTEPKE